jgi:hypothetical protein
VVGEITQGGGADAAHAKRKTEEETGDEADAVGEEFLRVNENGGERGCEDDADDDGNPSPLSTRDGADAGARKGGAKRSAERPSRGATGRPRRLPGMDDPSQEV